MPIVKSTHLKSVEYDKTKQRLLITFRSGGKYRYDHVEPGVVRGLLRSKSPGGYFNRKVKDNYDTKRLKKWTKRRK